MNSPLVISSVYSTLSVNKRRLCLDSPIDQIHEAWDAYSCPYDMLIFESSHGYLSLEAAKYCAKTGIGISLLNFRGDLLCTLLPRGPSAAKLHVQQYKAVTNDKTRNYIASAFVNCKIQQSIALLLKLADYYKVLDKDEIRRSFAEMEASFKGSSELLTREGNASIIYFRYMKSVFDFVAPKFNFVNRNGRSRSWSSQSSTPINSLLNYSYSIGEMVVRRIQNSIGFDMSIGYLHQLLDSRDSLVFDCLELVRWACDLSVLQLLEEGLKPSDFITTENYFVRLRPETAKRLVENVKVNFNTRSSYKGRNCTLENIVYNELRGLADFLMEKRSTLTFTLPEVQVKRNDDLELRNRVMSMTIEERRRLNIRRNTLWYMRKNIEKGKKVKIYEKVMNKIT